MRKILLFLLPLAALIITMGGALVGCTGENKPSDTLDTVVIKPISPIDSTSSAKDILTATGKVIDGAMNSVFIEISEDSVVEFSYPQLDRNNSEVFYSWSLDDNITVSYVKTQRNGEDVDSVVSIRKAE